MFMLDNVCSFDNTNVLQLATRPCDDACVRAHPSLRVIRGWLRRAFLQLYPPLLLSFSPLHVHLRRVYIIFVWRRHAGS